jgi:hypothetical protein
MLGCDGWCICLAQLMSLQVIDEDQYTPAVVYGAGSYTCTREQIGTRSISVGIHTLVDPAEPDDIKQVHALQDAIKVEQKDPGRFEAGTTWCASIAVCRNPERHMDLPRSAACALTALRNILTTKAIES